MQSLPASEFSISILSWINDELREEIALREQVKRRSRIASGMKAVALAGISGGMSMMFLRILQF